jgi:hypothetical protein
MVLMSAMVAGMAGGDEVVVNEKNEGGQRSSRREARRVDNVTVAATLGVSRHVATIVECGPCAVPEMRFQAKSRLYFGITVTGHSKVHASTCKAEFNSAASHTELDRLSSWHCSTHKTLEELWLCACV